jgi:hypothetical protein
VNTSVVPMLSASDEAYLRQTHSRDAHRRQDPSCVLCASLRAIDDDRALRPPAVRPAPSFARRTVGLAGGGSR